ncbi:hypothetical protein [Amaricoccus tamworthensis]|uniref:hypothetical protein n=1 Tax=Amaricoccus tamworthensis TaxID=57002 RepID=UPI003C7DCA87
MTGHTRKSNRPIIHKKFVGEGVVLHITYDEQEYILPHDTLVEWVEKNINALNTVSWQERGVYSWPRPSQAMLAFLEKFPA